MNKPVEKYISELLFKHDCVIVPNFGGFVGNHQSAKLNRQTNILYPPTKQILFNRDLVTNDGLLISHIANQESISQEEAKAAVIEFVLNSNDKLETTQILRLNNIGLFTLTSERTILFIQDNKINYLLSSFGLKETRVSKIVREKIIPVNSDRHSKNIKPIQFDSQYLIKVAAIILPLIILSFFSITQQEKINNAYVNFANVISLPSKMNLKLEEKTNVLTKKPLDAQIIKSDKINLNEVKKNPTVIASKKYYLIAGSFSIEKNASKLLLKLKKLNYNSSIIKSDNGFLRVSYGQYATRENALASLKDIKSKNNEVWLLTQ
tara:strand:+ start:674 stop:1636 length:963 start_codon:yes stop_codon:yes gene_type:complete